MLESQSNVIVFSSKHSTVSPSQTSTAEKEDRNEETMMTEEDDGISGTIHAQYSRNNQAIWIEGASGSGASAERSNKKIV